MKAILTFAAVLLTYLPVAACPPVAGFGGYVQQAPVPAYGTCGVAQAPVTYQAPIVQQAPIVYSQPAFLGAGYGGFATQRFFAPQRFYGPVGGRSFFLRAPFVRIARFGF